MSKENKRKVIHVDKLIIHAKKVEVINEESEHPRRDPWGLFWGRTRMEEQSEMDLADAEVNDKENH